MASKLFTFTFTFTCVHGRACDTVTRHRHDDNTLHMHVLPLRLPVAACAFEWRKTAGRLLHPFRPGSQWSCACMRRLRLDECKCKLFTSRVPVRPLTTWEDGIVSQETTSQLISPEATDLPQVPTQLTHYQTNVKTTKITPCSAEPHDQQPVHMFRTQHFQACRCEYKVLGWQVYAWDAWDACMPAEGRPEPCRSHRALCIRTEQADV